MYEAEAAMDPILLTASQGQRVNPTLQELQAQFDAIFEQTAVGFAHVALDGHFLRVNQKLCEMLGYTHHQLLMQRIQEITHPHTLETDLGLVQQLLRLEIRTYSIEKQYVKRTGLIIWGKLTVSLVLNQDKQPQYFVAVIEDISDRKRAEASLLRYNQRVLGLHAIEQAILAKRSPQDIAQTSLCHLRQLIPCQQAMVLLFDLEANEARVVSNAADGEPLFLENTLFALDKIYSSDELYMNKFRHISDLTRLTLPCLLSQRLISGGMRSSLAIPLFVQATMIGELLLVDSRPMAFNSDHVSVACEIADHLAIAIQNTRLFERVRSDRERLQNLSARLLEAQETERRYIAHELHDEIGQALTAIKINLQLLQRSLHTRDNAPRIDDSIVIVDNALQQVRHLSLDLRPSLLDDLGLQAALRWYIDRQIERTGIHINFQSHIELTLPPTIGTACFRIVQEALTNVVRHAQATSVTVILQQREDSLHLLIQDDGVGFDPQTVREQTARGYSLGLLGMEERALLVDGQITITSVPGQGTEIYLHLPLLTTCPAS